MIKIINGVFGYNNGKTVIPKTPKDEPFECDKATEKRLVDIGVAEYVTVEKPVEIVEETKPKADVVETKTEDETAPVEAEETPVKVSKDELIAEYKSLGLGGNPSIMHEETLIKKINEAQAALEEIAGETETDEEAPSFDKVDGVEG